MSNSETHIQTVERPPAASLPPTPVQVSPPAGPDLVTLVMVAIGVVVVAALYLAREVLIPITLAILLSFLLTPVVELLRRWHLVRVPAVLVAMMLALTVIVGVGGVIGSQVAQLATNIPQYGVTIESKIDTIRDHTIGSINRLAASLGHRSTPLNASQIPPKNQTPPGRSPGGPLAQP